MYGRIRKRRGAEAVTRLTEREAKPSVLSAIQPQRERTRRATSSKGRRSTLHEQAIDGDGTRYTATAALSGQWEEIARPPDIDRSNKSRQSRQFV